jgi:hypothetical protein
MRLRRLLSVTAVAALALPASASAGVVHVNWREQAKVGGKPVVQFHVETLASSKQGNHSVWVVVASVTNRSSKTLTLSKQFGLARYRGAKDVSPRLGTLLPALTFRPALPKTLRPGQTWRGAFGGFGVPPDGTYVRVVFGRFAGPAVPGAPFAWITDHARRWCSAASCTGYGA